ncbi:MAG TPA: hypothetical protein VLV88_00875 [Terriglobales bacterium]|nr:hypothetical protein [Terriglobales bacterium]
MNANASLWVITAITRIERCKTDSQLPALQSPPSDPVNIYSVLMQNALYRCDKGTIFGEIRSKLEAGELPVLAEANPGPDEFHGL